MNTDARQLFAIRADGFATRYVYAADRAELAANLARFGDRWGFIIVVSRTGKMHKASPGGPQHCNTRYGAFRTSHTADPRRVRHLAGFPSPFCAKCFGDTFAAALADVVELSAEEAATVPEAAPVAQPEAAPVAQPEAAPVAQPEAAPVAQPEAAPVAADNAQRIEEHARTMRAAGCNWPSVDEFLILYGDAATAADCDDYLSSFDPATAPKFEPEPMPATVACVPTWRALLPVILALLEKANGTSRETARAELARMAEAADRWNAYGAAMVRELTAGDGSPEALQRAIDAAHAARAAQ